MYSRASGRIAVVVAAAVHVVAGCSKPRRAEDGVAPMPAPRPNADDARGSWSELVEVSLAELRQKDSALPPADPAGQFLVDQDTGRFAMSDSSGTVTVEARFQFVGTYSTTSQSWFWSWANDSVAPAVRESVERVRAFGRAHGFDKLVTDRVPCSEQEALELFAVSIHVMTAQGWYRSALTPTSTAYIGLYDVKASR